MLRLSLCTALLLGASWVHAADADADALNLADQTTSVESQVKDWKLYVEGAAGQATSRHGLPDFDTRRLSVDLLWDAALAPQWRAVLADRMDINWRSNPAEQRTINTIKEAYVSWASPQDIRFDLGRINVFNGLALGYNPTDFFRAGSLRTVTSLDPASRKKDRQGSVMARVQALGEGQSLEFMYSPKLADTPDATPFGANLGTTNASHRWLLSWSRQWMPGISPQVLVYKNQGQSAQLGLNLSVLANDATVVYLEWSGGRSETLLSQALQSPQGKRFHDRLAAGLTYTTANKLSLTAEIERNSAALNRSDWAALNASAPPTYWRYRSWLQDAHETPTRHGVFFHARWQDALVNHLDLSAMMRHNLEDRSRLLWLEARYHWDRADLAWQWQSYAGRPGSEYGAISPARGWQLSWRYYF